MGAASLCLPIPRLKNEAAMTSIQNPFLPKDKIKILLLEGISDTAVQTLTDVGYENIERRTVALDGGDLRAALRGVRVLGIRSRTQMTAEMLAATNSLIAVGCFSVGTNQIDLDAARY